MSSATTWTGIAFSRSPPAIRTWRTCRPRGFTADVTALAGFDIAVITVPTPLRDGVPDLTYVESCLHTVGAHLRPGATVVLESTAYPGTTEEVVLPILEK